MGRSFISRLPVLLFSGVFALAFGLGGLAAGVWPILNTLASAWEVRDWRPVPAVVLSAELDERRGSKGSRTYAAGARYRYQFDGRSYESQRIGLDQSGNSDNVGDWHERWHARLEASRAQGLKLLAYVDPERPQRALLDPAIRWPMMAFHLPFALVFTGVGVGAAWVFWRNCRAGPQPEPSKRTLLGLAALFWCSLSWPLVAMVWLTPSPWVARIVVTLFGAVGLALALGWRRSAE